MSLGQTYWERYDIHGKVVEILRSRPGEFLTAYQLAIEFEHAFERGTDYPDYAVGGEGGGSDSSMTFYLAGQLSDRIDRGEVTEIECARLSHLHMARLAFKNEGREIGATTISSRDSQFIFKIL